MQLLDTDAEVKIVPENLFGKPDHDLSSTAELFAHAF